MEGDPVFTAIGQMLTDAATEQGMSRFAAEYNAAHEKKINISLQLTPDQKGVLLRAIIEQGGDLCISAQKVFESAADPWAMEFLVANDEPSSQETPPASPVPSPTGPLSDVNAFPTKGHVLIVDTYEGIRSPLGEALIQAGYTVHAVASHEEALSYYRQNRRMVSLIITGNMGNDGNPRAGIDMIKELQQEDIRMAMSGIQPRRRGSVPVILFTVNPDGAEESLRTIKEAYTRNVVVLPKLPVDLEALIEKVNTVVAASRSR